MQAAFQYHWNDACMCHLFETSQHSNISWIEKGVRKCLLFWVSTHNTWATLSEMIVSSYPVSLLILIPRKLFSQMNLCRLYCEYYTQFHYLYTESLEMAEAHIHQVYSVDGRPFSEPRLIYCQTMMNIFQWDFIWNSEVFINRGHLKMSSANCRPFCLAINVLMLGHETIVHAVCFISFLLHNFVYFIRVRSLAMIITTDYRK